MIQSIFIQSCGKEIEDGRFFDFFNKHLDIFKNIKIPIIIVLDWNASMEFEDKIIDFFESMNKRTNSSQRYNIIFVFDFPVENKTSFIFHFIMNYKVDIFKNILLLETDCILKKNFLKLIDEDLKQIENKNWFIYGSEYYGLLSPVDKKHMNGVAVYNRSPEFLNILNTSFFLENKFSLRINYDLFLSKKIKWKNLYDNCCIDSKYILNISPRCDMDLNPSKYKPKSVIIHQKPKPLKNIN